jgi:putative nucleotidyltransferase with HDIG domain
MPHVRYTTKDIAQLFPDLMQIRDASLRDKVAAVWNEAITTGCGGPPDGGWTFDELRAVKFTLLAGDINMSFIDHLNSCCRQCIAIAKVLQESFTSSGRPVVPINMDYLIAGSLLADCGKPLEYDKDPRTGAVIRGRYGDMLRHPFSGVAMCYKHGIPPEVMHIVATHSFEGDPRPPGSAGVQRSIEAIIFHHADFIDFDIARLLGAKAAKK